MNFRSGVGYGNNPGWGSGDVSGRDGNGTGNGSGNSNAGNGWGNDHRGNGNGSGRGNGDGDGSGNGASQFVLACVEVFDLQALVINMTVRMQS